MGFSFRGGCGDGGGGCAVPALLAAFASFVVTLKPHHNFCTPPPSRDSKRKH